ncbi:hypothetical protein GCM10020358_18860 [Amorphoplanes nipponensis]|uniref:Protein kinase domain-containing protein n=1 Tax=Actinoplanes nipponensis TaxID=135950 RepID=A0A919MI81_9ACTN|nr:protein kinase [Actinoplanes nipponensis]GIE50464.1 hypothetical protein Ani05nite_39980 [Actinoplanes nipponensis]
MVTEQQAWSLKVPQGYRVGRWRVGEPIATGTWSSVHEGVKMSGDGPDRVALKFVPAGAGTLRQQRAMAAREAAFARSHEGHAFIRTLEIRTVDDPGRPGLDGCVVLVMERAERSLRSVLLDAAPGRPIGDAGRLLAEIAGALRDLHEARWVHGDLKPANVLLMADGSVRLADFGLSAELEGTHAYLPVAGTSDYVPPEWWTERVSERGMAMRTTRDVWAFGVLAHQLLTGGLFPFHGGTARDRAGAAQQYAEGHADLRLATTIPYGWRMLIADCLAPDHARRSRHDAACLVSRIDELRSRRSGASRATLWRRVAAVAVVLAGTLVTTSAAAGVPPERPAPRRLGGELRPSAPVPPAYRAAIVAAGHQCSAPVTPALVAAMLKVESNFDPNLRSPQTDEYGIARWTPWVFQQWAEDQDGGGASPMSAADSIYALGHYLCGINSRPEFAKIPGDPALLLAAAFRNGSKRVIAANGVPAAVRNYVNRVAEYIGAYQQR